MSDSKFFDDVRGSFHELGAKMNKLYDDVMHGDDRIKFPVDIYETAEKYVFEAYLPGVEKGDLKVQIRENALHIKGLRKRELSLGELKFHRKEIRFGDFERSFALPAGVDTESIKARFEKGILTVKLAKEVVTESQNINID